MNTKNDNGITYSYEILPEYESFEGFCMASGDDAIDSEQDEWVRSQLADGNDAAWCTFAVYATRDSDGAEGKAFLGCCSYESAKALVADLYESQKAEALADLLASNPPKPGTVEHYASLGALPGAAKELAARSPFRIEGRTLVDCNGVEIADLRRIMGPTDKVGPQGKPSPHAFDVLCKALAAALAESAQ